MAIPIQIGILSARNFARTLREYDELAKHGRTAANLSTTVEFVPGGRARLLALSEKMAAQGTDGELVALLVDYIENADEFALARIRPYELARQWQQTAPGGPGSLSLRHARGNPGFAMEPDLPDVPRRRGD